MSLVLDAVVRSSLVLDDRPRGGLAAAEAAGGASPLGAGGGAGLAAAQPVISRIIPALPDAGDQLGASEDPSARRRSRRTSPLKLAQPATCRAATSSTTDWHALALMLWAAGAAVSLAILLFGALWLSWLGSRGDRRGRSLASRGGTAAARAGTVARRFGFW